MRILDKVKAGLMKSVFLEKFTEFIGTSKLVFVEST
jgi:hypothetical protein